MKAKEYVALCDGLSINTTTNKLLARKIIEIDKMFMGEIVELMNSRGTTDKVIIGILNELDNKWKSFASKVDFVTSTMFRERLNDIDPHMSILMGWN